MSTDTVRFFAFDRIIIDEFWQTLQCREKSSITTDDSVQWDDIEALLMKTKESALKRERALSHAFSHQVLI